MLKNEADVKPIHQIFNQRDFTYSEGKILAASIIDKNEALSIKVPGSNEVKVIVVTTSAVDIGGAL